jgi:hypothetical protein
MPEEPKLKILVIGGVRVELFNTDEVAKELGRCSRFVEREMRAGRLGRFRIGGRVYVRLEQLQEYVKRCEEPARVKTDAMEEAVHG